MRNETGRINPFKNGKALGRPVTRTLSIVANVVPLLQPSKPVLSKEFKCRLEM
jgi:hypothetical protein